MGIHPTSYYRNKTPAGRVMTWAFLIFIAAGLFVVGGCFYKDFATSRDIVGFLDRAQVAANVDRVSSYLEQLDDAMRAHGMTVGHAAFIFKTPQNDMGAMYQAVKDLRADRIPQVLTMNRSSPEYQTALDDIRGICRELEINKYAFKFRLRHDLMWMYAAGWISFFLILISGILALDQDEGERKSSFVISMSSILIIILCLM